MNREFTDKDTREIISIIKSRQRLGMSRLFQSLLNKVLNKYKFINEEDLKHMFSVCFLKVCDDIYAGIVIRKFVSYFMTLYHRKVMDFYRKNNSRNTIKLILNKDNIQEGLDSDTFEKHETFLQSLRNDNTFRLTFEYFNQWEKNNTKCFRLLNAFYFKNEKQKHIADNESISRKKISERIRQCREKLKKLIEQDDDYDLPSQKLELFIVN